MKSTSAFERRVMRKVIWRIMPLLLLSYFVASMDRANVGFAALTMNRAIGINAALFGWGAGIFFFGYFIFEVPSNLLMQRFGARRWIARIMVSWGVVAALMTLVSGPKSFLTLRFLLGVAEAGFFPGVLLYFTYWLPNRYRARAVGWLFFAYAISNSLTPIISGLLFRLHGILGLQGWQWMFLVEALPAIALAVPVLRLLPDLPSQCSWLDVEERIWLEETIAAERGGRMASDRPFHFFQLLTDTRTLAFSFMWFAVLTAGYGVTFFMPLMIRSIGELANFKVGLLTSIPYAVAVVGLIVFGYTSDRYNERFWHYIGSMAISTLGFLLAGFFHSSYLAVIALSAAALGLYSGRPAFWAMTAAYLGGPAAASGLAFVNSVGSLGGFVGPYVIGAIKTSTGSFQVALYFLAASIFLSGVVAYSVVPRKIGRTGKPDAPCMTSAPSQ